MTAQPLTSALELVDSERPAALDVLSAALRLQVLR
jgi:hypothetical protein